MGKIRVAVDKIRSLIPLGLLLIAVGCGHSTANKEGTVTGSMSTPGVLVPARAGDTWGGFVFFDSPGFIVPQAQVTPPARPLQPSDTTAEFPYDHPGYHQFSSVPELAGFVKGRAPVKEPAKLPSNAILIGAYAVEGSDGRILAMALNYALGSSGAPFRDPDIWISYDVYEQRPGAYATFVQDEALGRQALPAQKLTVQGNQAVYLEFTNPPGTHRELRLRSVISWYQDDGAFWTVQARDVSFPQLLDIANSLG